jgi:hypothetical protein
MFINIVAEAAVPSGSGEFDPLFVFFMAATAALIFFDVLVAWPDSADASDEDPTGDEELSEAAAARAAEATTADPAAKE